LSLGLTHIRLTAFFIPKEPDFFKLLGTFDLPVYLSLVVKRLVKAKVNANGLILTLLLDEGVTSSALKD